MGSCNRGLTSLLLGFPPGLFGQPRLQGLFSNLVARASSRGILRFQPALAFSRSLGLGGSL